MNRTGLSPSVIANSALLLLITFVAGWHQAYFTGRVIRFDRDHSGTRFDMIRFDAVRYDRTHGGFVTNGIQRSVHWDGDVDEFANWGTPYGSVRWAMERDLAGMRMWDLSPLSDSQAMEGFTEYFEGPIEDPASEELPEPEATTTEH